MNELELAFCHKIYDNALDGLYLPCADRMVRVRWLEGCADTPLPSDLRILTMYRFTCLSEDVIRVFNN